MCVKRRKGDLSVKITYDEPPPLTMSGLERGVDNPLASASAGGEYDEVARDEKLENPLYGDKVALVNNL